MSSKKLRIVVVGAGAVGLFYGAKLATTNADVAFIVQTAIEKIKTEGIQILSNTDKLVINKPTCFQSLDEVDHADWILLATKATANQQIAPKLQRLANQGSRLLILQNGLGNEEEFAPFIPKNQIAGGLCFVCLNRIEPGKVRHFGYGRMKLGQATGNPTPELEHLAARWQQAGLDVQCVSNLAEARWRKLIWNVPFNGLTIVLGGVGVNQVLQSVKGFKRCKALMEEIRTVANAYGFLIEPQFLDQQIEDTRKMGDYMPSTLLDWLAGKTIELEPIWLRPLHAARKAGIPVPELERLAQELQSKTPPVQEHKTPLS
ncbi:MAG: 2-dehydropantoate 2-reductase [Chthoniobacterales bacterium]|nr:2-dehydropantoate 2-reductase [Chthoniobacterales bacterium]